MILKRKNPNASKDNALKFTDLDGICCGDVKQATVCRYDVTIDVTSVTSVNTVSIGGTVYTLDGAYQTGEKRDRDALLENIKKIVHDLGYAEDGNIEYSMDGNNMTITVWFSQLFFDYLQAAANPFVPQECKVVGQEDSKCCSAQASIVKSGTDLVVTPISCNAITNVKVNDGGGDVYDGDLSDGTSGNATVASGVITIDGDTGGENWSGATTFTVTITSAGSNNCAAVVQTIQYTY